MQDDSKDPHQTTATMAPSTTTSEKVPELESGIDRPGNASDAFDVNNEEEYASGISLILLMVSLMLGMFLVALDNVGSSSLPPWHIFRD
jgi:hypothetical protein